MRESKPAGKHKQHAFAVVLALTLLGCLAACAEFHQPSSPLSEIKTQRELKPIVQKSSVPVEVAKSESSKVAKSKADENKSLEKSSKTLVAAKSDSVKEEAPIEVKKPKPYKAIKVKPVDKIVVDTAKARANAVTKEREVTVNDVTLILPKDWRATDSGEGRLATLTIADKSDGRAMDLYFEAQEVAAADEKAWQNEFEASLQASLSKDFSIDAKGDALIVTKKELIRRQAYLTRFLSSGALTLVLTTRDVTLERDLIAAKEVLASVALPATEARHAKAEKALGLKFVAPQGWGEELMAGELVLRPRWTKSDQASPRIRMRWVNTTINEEIGQEAYFRNMRKILQESFGGEWDVSAHQSETFAANVGASIQGTKLLDATKQRLWLVIFCQKRIVTIVVEGQTPNAKAQALALAASFE